MGRGNATAAAEAGCWPSRLSRSTHLFFRMRPVEAQEEVGVPAVQEEVCCSEGNREALDIVAEVGGDPEVRDEGVHEDILGRKGPTRKKESRRSVSRRSEQSSGSSKKGTHPRGAFGRANSGGEAFACPSHPLSCHAPMLLSIAEPYRRFGSVPGMSRLCLGDPRDGPRGSLGK